MYVVALLTGIVATGFANQMAMKRSRLETEIQTALSDGIISDDEKKKIDALRDQLNLTEEDALVLLEQLESKENNLYQYIAFFVDKILYIDNLMIQS